MKQLILIMLVYIASFVPLIVMVNSVAIAVRLTDLYFINHVSNFFIYLSVNKEFRKEAKNMMNMVMKKVRPA